MEFRRGDLVYIYENGMGFEFVYRNYYNIIAKIVSRNQRDYEKTCDYYMIEGVDHMRFHKSFLLLLSRK